MFSSIKIKNNKIHSYFFPNPLPTVISPSHWRHPNIVPSAIYFNISSALQFPKIGHTRISENICRQQFLGQFTRPLAKRPLLALIGFELNKRTNEIESRIQKELFSFAMLQSNTSTPKKNEDCAKNLITINNWPRKFWNQPAPPTAIIGNSQLQLQIGTALHLHM